MYSWLKSRTLETPLWLSAAAGFLSFVVYSLFGIAELLAWRKDSSGYPWLSLGVPFLLILMLIEAALHLRIHKLYVGARIAHLRVSGVSCEVDQVRSSLGLLEFTNGGELGNLWRWMLELQLVGLILLLLSNLGSLAGASCSDSSVVFARIAIPIFLSHMLMQAVMRAQIREAQVVPKPAG